MNTAIWFTNDLRVFDNKAFAIAMEQGAPVVAFFLRPKLGSKEYVQFQNESLDDLARDLEILARQKVKKPSEVSYAATISIKSINPRYMEWKMLKEVIGL